MRTRLLLAVLFGLVAVLPAPVPASASTEGVSIIPSNRFSPREVTIRTGDTVRWTNNSPGFHSVTADTDAFPDSNENCSTDNTSACMKPGDTYSATFRNVGTFTYRCKIHANSGMTGSVVVAPAMVVDVVEVVLVVDADVVDVVVLLVVVVGRTVDVVVGAAVVGAVVGSNVVGGGWTTTEPVMPWLAWILQR